MAIINLHRYRANSQPIPPAIAETENIYFGFVQNGDVIAPLSGDVSKVIKATDSYFILPPRIGNITGNENTLVQLWIAEPLTEPAKTATLWIRNFASTFTNQDITSGAIMTVQTIGLFRVYVSEGIPAQMFNGQHFGPVYCSRINEKNISFTVIPAAP